MQRNSKNIRGGHKNKQFQRIKGIDSKNSQNQTERNTSKFHAEQLASPLPPPRHKPLHSRSKPLYRFNKSHHPHSRPMTAQQILIFWLSFSMVVTSVAANENDSDLISVNTTGKPATNGIANRTEEIAPTDPAPSPATSSHANQRPTHSRQEPYGLPSQPEVRKTRRRASAHRRRKNKNTKDGVQITRKTPQEFKECLQSMDAPIAHLVLDLSNASRDAGNNYIEYLGKFINLFGNDQATIDENKMFMATDVLNAAEDSHLVFFNRVCHQENLAETTVRADYETYTQRPLAGQLYNVESVWKEKILEQNQNKGAPFYVKDKHGNWIKCNKEFVGDQETAKFDFIAQINFEIFYRFENFIAEIKEKNLPLSPEILSEMEADFGIVGQSAENLFIGDICDIEKPDVAMQNSHLARLDGSLSYVELKWRRYFNDEDMPDMSFESSEDELGQQVLAERKHRGQHWLGLCRQAMHYLDAKIDNKVSQNPDTSKREPFVEVTTHTSEHARKAKEWHEQALVRQRLRNRQTTPSSFFNSLEQDQEKKTKPVQEKQVQQVRVKEIGYSAGELEYDFSWVYYLLVIAGLGSLALLLRRFLLNNNNDENKPEVKQKKPKKQPKHPNQPVLKVASSSSTKTISPFDSYAPQLNEKIKKLVEIYPKIKSYLERGRCVLKVSEDLQDRDAWRKDLKRKIEKGSNFISDFTSYSPCLSDEKEELASKDKRTTDWLVEYEGFLKGLKELVEKFELDLTKRGINFHDVDVSTVDDVDKAKEGSAELEIEKQVAAAIATPQKVEVEKEREKGVEEEKYDEVVTPDWENASWKEKEVNKVEPFFLVDPQEKSGEVSSDENPCEQQISEVTPIIDNEAEVENSQESEPSVEEKYGVVIIPNWENKKLKEEKEEGEGIDGKNADTIPSVFTLRNKSPQDSKRQAGGSPTLFRALSVKEQQLLEPINIFKSHIKNLEKFFPGSECVHEFEEEISRRMFLCQLMRITEMLTCKYETGLSEKIRLFRHLIVHYQEWLNRNELKSLLTLWDKYYKDWGNKGKSFKLALGNAIDEHTVVTEKLGLIPKDRFSRIREQNEGTLEEKFSANDDELREKLKKELKEKLTKSVCFLADVYCLKIKELSASCGDLSNTMLHLFKHDKNTYEACEFSLVSLYENLELNSLLGLVDDAFRKSFRNPIAHASKKLSIDDMVNFFTKLFPSMLLTLGDSDKELLEKANVQQVLNDYNNHCGTQFRNLA